MLFRSAWFADFCELTGRRDLRFSTLSDAEQFAINWLATMLHFQRARETMPERVMPLGFEAFLAEPAGQLGAVARFLGLDPAGVAQAMAGPLMRSYAKNPSVPFDARARQRELEEGRRAFAGEIGSGMALAEKLCGEMPMLAPLTAQLRRAP